MPGLDVVHAPTRRYVADVSTGLAHDRWTRCERIDSIQPENLWVGDRDDLDEVLGAGFALCSDCFADQAV